MPSPDSLRILIAIVPLLLILIGIMRPVYGLVGYMCLVYGKTSAYYPIFAKMKAELVIAVLLLILIVLSKRSLKLSPYYDRVNLYVLLFTGSVFFSYIIAFDRQYSWDNAVLHLIKSLVIYILCLSSIHDIKDLKIFVWSFIVFFVFLAYEPLYNFILGQGGSVHTYGVNYIADIGLLSGHVALANNMNQMIPFTFYFLLYEKKMRNKIIAGVFLSIFVFTLIGSGSRAGVVGLMVFGMIVTYFSRQRLKVAAIFSVMIVLLFATTKLSHTTTRIEFNSDSGAGRITGLTHGIGMVQKGNIFGVGPGCFPIARKQYFNWTMESHNIYGEIIGELGIPGMITSFLLLYYVLQNLVKVKKQLEVLNMKSHYLYTLSIALLASLMVRLVISFASHGIYYFYWYLIAALSIIIKKFQEQLEENIKPVDIQNVVSQDK